MKYIFKLTLLVLALLSFNVTNSYNNELAFSGERETIRELKENIDVLDKTNFKLDKRLKNLNADYKLRSLLKEELDENDVESIKKIINEYNINKEKIEETFLNKARKLQSVTKERKMLLEEKRKLYSGLIPYINTDFKKDYLEYIRGDSKIFNEKKNVTKNIIVKKEILNNKVEAIEDKIKKHKEFIEQNIKNVIEVRIEQKVSSLNNNETFKKLDRVSKLKVLEKSIEKIKIKLNNLENIRTNIVNTGSLIESTSLLYKKIQTYNIAVEKLEIFRDGLK